MAKFRDSKAKTIDGVVDAPFAESINGEASSRSADESDLHDRSIGDILVSLRNLSADQVEKALQHQRAHGVRFGEAAVELGYVTRGDVLYALSQQFNYPYSPENSRNLSPELVSLNEPFSPRAEGFRALRSQLIARLYSGTEARHALAVVSPESGDGKTYCAANLAVSLAQLGGQTLLVDADMRGPRIHELFRLANKGGLSSILAGRAQANVLQQVASVPSLFVLPVGTTPPNPLELVERPAFGLLIRELISKFDHVVVDTPAACFGSDSMVIAARCGSALLVARKNKGHMDGLQRIVAGLSGSPNMFAGVVMNEY